MQNNLSNTNKEKRKALKDKLKWGDIAKIANVANVNRITVERWFNDDNDNKVVQQCVEILISEREKSIAQKIASFL
jgi:hypothetical protein